MLTAERLQEGLEAGMKLAAELAFYRAVAAILLWGTVIDVLADDLSLTWGGTWIATAVLGGLLCRWAERGKQPGARRGN